MRVHVAVALLLAGLVAVPPAAADHEHVLTVSGNGPGYVDVRIPHSVLIDVPHSTFGPGVSGFYIEARHGDAHAGTVTMNVKGAWPALIGDKSLPAGEYRVYLLTDHPTSIGIRMAYLPRDVSVRATRKTYVRVSAGPIEVRRETARWAGRRDLRLRGGPRSILATMLHMSLPDALAPVPYQWGDVYQCSAQPDGPGCDDASVQTKGLLPEERHTGVTKYHWAAKGTVPQGQTWFQHYAGSVAPDDAYGVAIELVLVP